MVEPLCLGGLGKERCFPEDKGYLPTGHTVFSTSHDGLKEVLGTLVQKRERTASFVAITQGEIRNLNTTMKTYWDDPAYPLRFAKDQEPGQ